MLKFITIFISDFEFNSLIVELNVRAAGVGLVRAVGVVVSLAAAAAGGGWGL